LRKALLLATALIAMPVAASAGLLGSSVSGYVSLGVGASPPSDECKRADISGAVGAGLEVGAGAFSGLCAGLVTLDVDDTSIVLSGQLDGFGGDYTYLVVDLVFTGAGRITAVELSSSSLFAFGNAQPDPTITFDDDSIRIVFDPPSTNFFVLAEGGQAVFSINAESLPAVSAPTAFSLFGLGLAGLGLVGRTRRQG
jgi:hypothetical protein